MWDVITYPFLNFNVATVEVWKFNVSNQKSARNVKKISLLIQSIIFFVCPRSNLTGPAQFLVAGATGQVLVLNTGNG